VLLKVVTTAAHFSRLQSFRGTLFIAPIFSRHTFQNSNLFATYFSKLQSFRGTLFKTPIFSRHTSKLQSFCGTLFKTPIFSRHTFPDSNLSRHPLPPPAQKCCIRVNINTLLIAPQAFFLNFGMLSFFISSVLWSFFYLFIIFFIPNFAAHLRLPHGTQFGKHWFRQMCFYVRWML
jgi:hypothetical protein